MEEYIIYLVIAGSIVANIYSNYKKQQKKDSKRVIGKPAQNVPSTSAKPATQAQPKRKTAAATVKPKQPQKIKSEIESSIEKYLSENPGTSMEYTSLESTIGNYSSIGDVAISSINAEGFDDETEPIEKDGIKDEQAVVRKAHSLFETKDDLKKAILYTAILERKY